MLNADLRDTIVFASFAVLLLVALVATRRGGFLLAALPFAGLSVAKYMVMNGEDSGGAVLLGPGVGFLVAYLALAATLRRPHWWPLVPGTIMTLLGGLLVLGGPAGRDMAGGLWPIVFVGIALLVYAAVMAVRRPEPAPSGSHV